MSEEKINEDFLLLLIDKNGFFDTITISIDKHFKVETEAIEQLCGGTHDNINAIISFLRNTLKPKLPDKLFKYCKELDKAYQSVHVNIDLGIQDIINRRNLIFTNQKIAERENKEFNIEVQFTDLKNYIREKIELWFKVFDTEFAYEKAKKVTNMRVYSHRISGWSNPEYKITKNLKQQVKTNFGYGSVSYFYSLLTYKNIQITPLSEWIDYRYSNFSNVIRYTRSFRSRVPVTNKNNDFLYFKTKIENEYWHYAIEFTKNAANLSLSDEKKFIKHYILDECESMVEGLEEFYKETQYEFIDENQITVENKAINKHRVSYDGYELIDFRTEKIIGALDFIEKIIEYNSILPTQEYSNRIISLCKKFIPNVHSALENQNVELSQAKKDLDYFMINHNQLLKKNAFFNNQKKTLKKEFETRYEKEYHDFIEQLVKSNEELKHHRHKVKLHSDNIRKLTNYITKYKKIVG